MVNNPLLKFLECRVLANLSPPLLEHILVHISTEQTLAVQHLQRDLFELCLYNCVGLIRFPNIESLDGLTPIPFEKKIPHFLIVDMVVILVVFVLVDILVNEVRFHALNLTSAEQVLPVGVLLAQLIHIHHRTWMILGEMVFLVEFELILAHILVELIEEDESVVLFKPLVADQIRRRAHFIVRGHIILFLEQLVLLVLIEDL